MKNFLKISLLFLSIGLLVQCTKKSDQTINSNSPRAELLQGESILPYIQKKYKEDPSSINIIKIESMQPYIVSSQKDIDNVKKKIDVRGAGGCNPVLDCSDGQLDCCCECEASLTFNGTNPTNLLYSLEVFGTCSSNPFDWFTLNVVPLGGPWRRIDGYTPGTTVNFDIIDEHYYIFAGVVDGLPGNTLNFTVNDPSCGVYNIDIKDYFIEGLSGLVIIMLHCDVISYSNCWEGNVFGGSRECCYDL